MTGLVGYHRKLPAFVVYLHLATLAQRMQKKEIFGASRRTSPRSLTVEIIDAVDDLSRAIEPSARRPARNLL
jgi:hypothetical protein